MTDQFKTEMAQIRRQLTAEGEISDVLLADALRLVADAIDPPPIVQAMQDVAEMLARPKLPDVVIAQDKPVWVSQMPGPCDACGSLRHLTVAHPSAVPYDCGGCGACERRGCLCKPSRIKGQSMSDYKINLQVLEAIAAERQRQIDKWGIYKDMPPPTWLMVLGEEFGEACAAAHDTLYDVAGKADEDHLDAELVQVAAVAIAWLEERRLGMSMCRPEYRHDYTEEATNG